MGWGMLAHLHVKKKMCLCSRAPLCVLTIVSQPTNCKHAVVVCGSIGRRSDKLTARGKHIDDDATPRFPLRILSPLIGRTRTA